MRIGLEQGLKMSWTYILGRDPGSSEVSPVTDYGSEEGLESPRDQNGRLRSRLLRGIVSCMAIQAA